MPKRWLGLLLLVISISTYARTAEAAIAASPASPAINDPVDGAMMGTTINVGLTASPTENNSRLTFGTDCDGFTFEFNMMEIGPTTELDLSSTPTVIQVTYTATDRTAHSCSVFAFDSDDNPIGTFAVSGDGLAPVLTIDPPKPADFGDVRVLDPFSSNRTIVVRNNGELTLSVTGMAITGAASTEFSITSSGTFMVPAGGTADVAVTFDPAMPGSRDATLTITGNDPLSSTEEIDLHGDGLNARLHVTDRDFGVVQEGTTGPNQPVTLSNDAVAPVGDVLVTNVTLTQGSNWFRFGGTNGCTANATTCPSFTDATLGAATNVQLRCVPPDGASGTQMATLTFQSNTDAGGDETSTLMCTAGRPEIMVVPLMIMFNNQFVGTSSATQNVVITNGGNANLTYTLTETDAGDQFQVLTGCVSGCTVTPGNMETLTVRFRPTSMGAKSAMLSIAHNDDNTLTQVVNLSGTGTAPVLTRTAPATPSIAFGSIEMGSSSAPVTVTINNNLGTEPLTITSVALSGAGSNENSYAIGGTGMTGSHTVAVGASESWTVTCTPLLQGAQDATFTIVSNTNGTAGTQTNIDLTCNGTRGVLELTPATHDFMGVPTGNVVSQNFTVRNTGNVAVTNVQASLVGGVAAFTISSTAPTFPLASLAPNATATITVRFAPLIATDDGPVTLSVSGVWGTAATAASDTSTINGNGLAAGYDATPATVDFMGQRWDTTTTRTFCIENTGESNVTLNSMTLMPTGATVTGELTLLSARRNCSGAPGANVPLPISNVLLTPSQTVLVTVQMNPNDRTGAITGTVTIGSDFMSNPTRVVMITGTSTTGGVSVAPGMTVDFGATDLDGGPVMRDVVITNTGDGPLNLAAFATTPPTSTLFTVGLPAGAQVLQPGAMVTIPVTYQPALERPVGQNDEIVLSHTMTGVLGGPPQQMITIRGRGVDRHIDVGAAPMFPPTFRNPGTAAPTRMVTVQNTGDAELVISGVMVSNSDIWQLVDANPVTVPGGGSHDFEVRFVPKMGGVAPPGDLVFMNNDNAEPMAGVTLEGIGLDRMVSLLNDPINLGITGIGIPITLPEGLVIASMDATNPFTIREVQLDDVSGAFAIENSPEGETLAPSAMSAYDITFTPTEEGEFEATAYLFLDEDQEATTQVRIRGQAVFAKLGGGGGCSTSHDGGAGVVLVVGALLLARRRRRLALAATAIVALVVLAPATARAQEASSQELSLDLSLFQPTPSTTGTTLQVQSADVGKHGTWMLGATMSNASNPLTLSFTGTEHMSISRRTMIELGGAFAFLDRFEAGVRLPLYNQTGDGTQLRIDSPSGTAIGDLVAHVKAMAFKTSGAAEVIGGASVAVTIPTATEQQFAGIDKPSVRALALLTVTPHARLTLSANAGGVIRAKSQLSNIQQGSGVAFGGAASVRVLDALWLFGELYGDVLPSAEVPDAMSSAQTMVTAEWLGGVTYRPDPRFTIVAGAGRGLVSGIGTPDLRAVLSISFAPGNEAPPSLTPPPLPVVDGDADSDGIRDSVDTCKTEPEDQDGFADDDGCPDTDNDGDSFLDSDDKCRNEAEDKDGFADDDGCPDPDNDSDGVLDADDKCPAVAEDRDGTQDDDGCPDNDNDGDGIADAADKCPAQAETINGNSDDDGCPDAGDSAVALTPSAIELLEAIEFVGPKIKAQSGRVLGQVAATLRAHPEIVRIKINAHVNASNDPDKDKTVTEQRVIEIREWLIKAGVAAERLAGSGMGGTKPLVKDKKTPINERIEIIILERK